jgi:hypothetical protein
MIKYHRFTDYMRCARFTPVRPALFCNLMVVCAVCLLASCRPGDQPDSQRDAGLDATRQAQFSARLAELQFKARQDPSKVTDNMLRDLEDLAQSADDFESVAELREVVEKTRRDKKQRRIEEFSVQLKRFQDELGELDTTQQTLPLAELLGRLIDLERRIDGLVVPGGTDESVRNRLGTLKKTIEWEKARVSQQIEFQRARDEITNRLADLQAFRQAQLEFVRLFPESTTANDLRRIEPEVGRWYAMQAWSDFFQLPAWSNLANITPQSAEAMAARAYQLSQQLHSSVLPIPLQERLESLKYVVARRDFRNVPITERLKEFLHLPEIEGLGMLELASGERYYTPGDELPDVPSDGRPFTAKIVLSRKLDIAAKPFSPGDVVYVGVAPQSALATRIRARMNAMDEAQSETSREPTGGMTEASWESVFCGCLQDTLSQERLDPILKITFLKRWMDTGCEGSYCMSSVFQLRKRFLKAHTVDASVNWFQPDDRYANRERRRAEGFLKDLESVDKACTETLEKLAELCAPPPPVFQRVGWLARDAHGGWQALGVDPLPRGGQLQVVVVIGEGAATTMQLCTLASIREGKVELDRSQPPAVYVEGRPLYLVDEKK